MSKEGLLNLIRKYQFYAIDLNLYLYNFPNNKCATNDFKYISSYLSKLIYQYECNYGPLTNFGSAYIENPRLWVSTPWPWEKK